MKEVFKLLLCDTIGNFKMVVKQFLRSKKEHELRSLFDELNVDQKVWEFDFDMNGQPIRKQKGLQQLF